MSIRRYLSPLRYRGGKARMARFLGEMFAQQIGAMDIEVWIEPFAGGAGAGLALLEARAVGEVWLTEKNPPDAAGVERAQRLVRGGDAVPEVVGGQHTPPSSPGGARSLTGNARSDA